MPNQRDIRSDIYTKPQFLESVMRKYGFRDWDSVLGCNRTWRTERRSGF